MEKGKTLEEMSEKELEEFLAIQEEHIACNLGMPSVYFNLNLNKTDYYEQLYREVEEEVLKLGNEEILIKFNSLISLAEFKGYNQHSIELGEAIDLKIQIEEKLKGEIK